MRRAARPGAPEIRRDFLLERRVVIAPERAHRPQPQPSPPETDDAGNCPFCPGREAETPPEVLALGRGGGGPDTPGWAVRVVPNKFPALVADADPVRAAGDGKREPGRGLHEVVVETPRHEARWHTLSPAERALVLEAVTRRTEDLTRRPGVRSVLVFRNEGRAAGATLSHPHLQILALPLVSPGVEAEERAARSRSSPGDPCPWCRWLEIELRGSARVIAADERTVVLCPWAPRVPFEIWILPREHAASFTGSSVQDREAVGEALARVAARLHEVLGEVATNWFLHSLGPGETAPHYHWHLEVLPRTVHAAGFEWGSGLYLHPVFPEAAAAILRETGITGRSSRRARRR